MADSNDKKPIDPYKKAVALTYEHGDDPAPRVAAKGEGFIAEQIIAIAEQHGITVHEDSNLVEVLQAVELDTFIPVETYVAVAEILRYIYQANAKAEGR